MRKPKRKPATIVFTYIVGFTKLTVDDQNRMNQVSSLENHLSRSGDNLRLYYFKTLVGFALVTAVTMWQIDLALKGKSQITPYLVTGTSFIYHMSALRNIEKSGIELKRASRAIEKSKNKGKEN